MDKVRLTEGLRVFLCCVLGLAGTGCVPVVMGLAGGLSQHLDHFVLESGPAVDTTYQSDVPTVANLVSQVVTKHTAQSQFALTRSTAKNDPADREIQLHSAQGSRLVLRIQDANENGATASRLRIWTHVKTDIKIIGAGREDAGAANEFGQIMAKVRQETTKRKLKILRDTVPR